MTHLPTFQVTGRTIELTRAAGCEETHPLSDIRDVGGISVSVGEAALVRLFVAPREMVLLADLWEGPSSGVFDRLCSAHFRRNFGAVGVFGLDTEQIREEWTRAWLPWRASLDRSRAPGRKPLQIGHIEETADGFQWIRPRSESPDVPVLTPTPVSPSEIDLATAALTRRLTEGAFGLRRDLTFETLTPRSLIALKAALATVGT